MKTKYINCTINRNLYINNQMKLERCLIERLFFTRCSKLSNIWSMNQLKAHDCRGWSPPNTFIATLSWFSPVHTSYRPLENNSSPENAFHLYVALSGMSNSSISSINCSLRKLKLVTSSERIRERINCSFPIFDCCNVRSSSVGN